MTCYPQILPVRKQDELILKFLRKRLDTILPDAMRKAGLDMWLVLCQEDNPDPVFQTMIPMNTWTPILQVLIFFDRGPGKGVERINLSMTNLLDLYDTAKALEKSFVKVHYEHILRNFNKRADELSNIAVKDYTPNRDT